MRNDGFRAAVELSELWSAINAFVRLCGGDTLPRTSMQRVDKELWRKEIHDRLSKLIDAELSAREKEYTAQVCATCGRTRANHRVKHAFVPVKVPTKRERIAEYANAIGRLAPSFEQEGGGYEYYVHTLERFVDLLKKELS